MLIEACQIKAIGNNKPVSGIGCDHHSYDVATVGLDCRPRSWWSSPLLPDDVRWREAGPETD